MFKIKKNKSILFLVGLFSIFITKVKADIQCFKVPQNKSLLLSASNKYSPDLKWETADKSIASVDDKGIVTGVSQGKTEVKVINLKNNLNEISYIVEVTEQEPIRTFGLSSNLVVANGIFQAKLFTPKNVDAVKFLVTGKNYRKEFFIDKKGEKIKNNLFWKKDIKIQSEGVYHIEAYSKTNGKWKTCDEGKCDLKVVKKYNTNGTFLEEKRISENCENFIKSFEGFVPDVYKDVAGYLTIGYGKLILPYDLFYDNISKEEGNLIFLKGLNDKFSKPLNKFLMDNKIKCGQNQFDALLSFTYNLGIGWLSSENKIKKTILDSRIINKVIFGNVNASNGIYLRKTLDTTLDPIGKLKYGDTVTILSEEKENGNWYRVATESGEKGFCHSDYLKLNSVNVDKIDLDKIDKNEFITYFSKYHHAGGECYWGLLKRRFSELDIFFDGKYAKDIGQYKVSDFKYEIPECIKNKILNK